MTAPTSSTDISKLSARYFDRIETDGLLAVRQRIDAILDMRARQYDLFSEAPAPKLIELPKRVELPPAEGVADRLSPSQVANFLDCQARWYYEKVLCLPRKLTASLALGHAVHAALAENFAQKIETHEDLDVPGVQALFAGSLEQQREELVLSEDDDIGDLVDTGAALVRLYMEESAPLIEPAAVELEVSGEIAGVPVLGYIDLLDVDGCVIDIKTAKKKPVGVRPGHRLQVASYRLLCDRASGVARIDTLVKTKTVALHSMTFDVNAADIRNAEVLYPLVQESMRSGLYTPNRSSYLCSAKYCSYCDRCVAEYGGEIT